MNRSHKILLLIMATAVMLLVSGCSLGGAVDEMIQANATRPPTNTPLPPTDTPIPTDTPVPTPTAALGSVAIVQVFNAGYKEYVEITNKGEADRDLSGWVLEGSKGEEGYVFPEGYVLAVGDTVRIHSGKDGVNAAPSDIYWTDKNLWNNAGEKVFLRDATGRAVSEYTY